MCNIVTGNHSLENNERSPGPSASLRLAVREGGLGAGEEGHIGRAKRHRCALRLWQSETLEASPNDE